jgi:hypothetical protein
MKNEKKLYRVENNERIYDYETNIDDIFYSEIFLVFKNHLNFGAKIFYLRCVSKHCFKLTDNEINYLYTLDARYYEELYYVFSENIKTIKCKQRVDLFFLTSLKHLYFVCLIPKLDDEGCYYFNLILGVKPEFNINQFYD